MGLNGVGVIPSKVVIKIGRYYLIGDRIDYSTTYLKKTNKKQKNPENNNIPKFGCIIPLLARCFLHKYTLIRITIK